MTQVRALVAWAKDHHDKVRESRTMMKERSGQAPEEMVYYLHSLSIKIKCMKVYCFQNRFLLTMSRKTDPHEIYFKFTRVFRAF